MVGWKVGKLAALMADNSVVVKADEWVGNLVVCLVELLAQQKADPKVAWLVFQLVAKKVEMLAALLVYQTVALMVDKLVVKLADT